MGELTFTVRIDGLFVLLFGCAVTFFSTLPVGAPEWLHVVRWVGVAAIFLIGTLLSIPERFVNWDAYWDPQTWPFK